MSPSDCLDKVEVLLRRKAVAVPDFPQEPVSFSPCQFICFLTIIPPFMITSNLLIRVHIVKCLLSLYPPQTLFVVGILFSRCPCVRASVRASVRNVLFF